MHPKATQANAEAYKRLMAGESLDGLYESKIFEKEMTKAGKIAKETGADVKETKKEAITSVLENVKGMPMMNLVRNLRNILTLAPEKVDDAVKRYKQLIEKGIVIRNRTTQPLCENTLRLTVGTIGENKKLIEALKAI